MAAPNSKDNSKEYCLRSLGKPVIEINVDDDQVDDRLDEALQYFAEYHMDGVQRTYLKHQITSAEKTRGTSDTQRQSQMQLIVQFLQLGKNKKFGFTLPTSYQYYNISIILRKFKFLCLI